MWTSESQEITDTCIKVDEMLLYNYILYGFSIMHATLATC